MSEDETGVPTVRDLFPDSVHILLTGSGKELIERIGIETIRNAVLSVMVGENLRTQTEPLSRRRIAHVAGAIVALFVRGHLEIADFTGRLSSMALEQIASAKRNDNATIWPAQWLIGLTGKSVQNVLRRDPAATERYVKDFEKAVEEAANKCRDEFGDLRMTLGFVEDSTGRRAELDWVDVTRLTTAIGAETLTIRGSEKSMYGKLFEKLILGSILTVLGFERVNPSDNSKTQHVFWLSDSSASRECDATILYEPGRLVRFDIGFIGEGNSEISKDKLSRYESEINTGEGKRYSITFIIVDKLPRTGKTQKAAEAVGAEIIQMSMQYWPRELAQKLGGRLGFRHELQEMPDDQIKDYLTDRLKGVAVQYFLSGVSQEDLLEDTELPEAADEIEAIEDDD
jgi:hypothetical protein